MDELGNAGQVGRANVHDFERWLVSARQTDATVALMWDLAYMVLAIFALHDAVRTNDAELKHAARRVFMPVWFARNHPNMARSLLEDERTYCTAPPAVKHQMERNTSARRLEAYQGHDAVLEELNKLGKSWSASAPSPDRWIWICRNAQRLEQLREYLDNILGTRRTDIGAQRTRPSNANELYRWRSVLRQQRYAVPTVGRPVTSASGTTLSSQVSDVLVTGRKRCAAALEVLLRGNIVSSGERDRVVPTTLAEEEVLASDESKTNRVTGTVCGAVAAADMCERRRHNTGATQAPRGGATCVFKSSASVLFFFLPSSVFLSSLLLSFFFPLAPVPSPSLAR